MSVVATVTVDTADFALGQALTAETGIRVRLERVVPVGETSIPYLRVTDDAVADIERALQAEADIDSFEIVDTPDGEALVRVEWDEPVSGFLEALGAAGATILEGVGEAETWRFEVRVDDHERLTEFYRACAERDIGIELVSAYNPGVPREFAAGFGLTETQRETLRVALEDGYFDVPRRTNLVELADELDISDSAASQRLRRGIDTVLAAVLAERDGQPSEESTRRRNLR